MIKTLLIIESTSLDPHFNQAIEASLTELARADTQVLYIWANDKTVFIGRNQNAFKECNVQRLKADGGIIARRISGGGAVYHDRGNLNFTFVSRRENYSVEDNFAIVLDAVRSFGIEPELSGRNDCTIGGKKFSGNAFYKTSGGCFHHGTILISTTASEIAKYLNISEAKISHRAVKSVPSRVTNLASLNSAITYESFATALKNSFVTHYQKKLSMAQQTDSKTTQLGEVVESGGVSRSGGGLEVAYIGQRDIDAEVFGRWHGFFGDEGHIMGDDIEYNFGLEHRFDFGTADIRLQLDEDGTIQKAKIYSDTLECDIRDKENILIGKKIHPNCKEKTIELLESLFNA